MDGFYIPMTGKFDRHVDGVGKVPNIPGCLNTKTMRLVAEHARVFVTGRLRQGGLGFRICRRAQNLIVRTVCPVGSRAALSD